MEILLLGGVQKGSLIPYRYRLSFWFILGLLKLISFFVCVMQVVYLFTQTMPEDAERYTLIPLSCCISRQALGIKRYAFGVVFGPVIEWRQAG